MQLVEGHGRQMIEYLLTVERTEESVLRLKTKFLSTAETKEREREQFETGDDQPSIDS